MGWQDRDYHREDSYGGAPAWGSTPVTWALIIINSVVFVLDSILDGAMRGSSLAPWLWGRFTIDLGVYHGQIWRWFTFQFIHSGFMHVFFNMLGLYFFGRQIEQHWRGARFLVFYLLCGISGAAVFTGLFFLMPAAFGWGPESPIVGASGGVFGVLIACAMLFPRQRVMLMFPPIPMSMRTMALVFLGISLLSLMVGSQNAGGEAAHLGGAALGAALTRWPGALGFTDAISGGFWGRVRQKRGARRRASQAEELRREEAEVDRILAKVREHGLHSLTRGEKKTLQRATDRQRHVG